MQRSYTLPFLLFSSIGFACSGASGVDRSRLPDPLPSKPWSPPRVQELEANGRTLWHVDADHVPLVSMRVLIPAGTADECAPGALHLLADWLEEGAGDYDTFGFDRALKGLATDLWFDAGEDHFVIAMEALARNYPASMELMRQAILAPHLSDESFEKIKGLQSAHAAAALEDPDFLRRRLTRKVLHEGAGYPYARLNAGTRSELAALTPDQVRTAHRWLLAKLSDAAIISVGALPAGSVAEELDFEFREKVPTGALCANRAAPTKRSDGDKPTIHFWVKDGAPQTGITVVKPLPRTDADYFADTLFARVLGSAFTSRLNMNLREDKGYTYGAFGGFQRSPRADVFALSSRVKAEVSAESLSEMLSELHDIQGSHPIEDLEFRNSRQGLRLGYPQRFESLSGIASHLAELRRLGREPSWLTGWADGIQGVSRQNAQDRAAAMGESEDFFIVMVGDRRHAKNLEKAYALRFYGP